MESRLEAEARGERRVSSLRVGRGRMDAKIEHRGKMVVP